MLCFLAALGGARFFRAATAVFLGLLALFFGIHAVYHDIFSEYLSVGMLGVAGGALTGYWREALRGIVRCLPEILLMLAPFVLWLVFGKRLAPEGLRGRRKLLPLLLFLALQLAASAGVRLCTGGAVPLSLSYGEGFVMDTGVLLQSGISVKESRGRLSYLTPDRTKPITARKLGDDFDRTAVLALLEQNAHRAAEQTTPIPEYPGSMTGHLQREKSAKIAPKQDGLQRMVDRETKRAEGKGVGYDRWASLHNLKQMAATHNFLMENGLLDLDKLDAAVESSRKALSEARESLRGIEQTIADKKNLRKVVSDYRRTRPTIEEHKKLKGKKTETYYRANEADFIIYEATLRQLKVLAPGKKLPAISKLNTEIEALISEKNAAYNTYRTAKAEHEQLATAKRNTEQILHGTPSRQKKHEQER